HRHRENQPPHGLSAFERITVARFGSPCASNTSPSRHDGSLEIGDWNFMTSMYACLARSHFEGSFFASWKNISPNAKYVYGTYFELCWRLISSQEVLRALLSSPPNSY